MTSRARIGHAFLTATRRSALKCLAALSFTAVAPKLVMAARTPSAAEGPFYPTEAMRFADADNDLVKIDGAVRSAGGEVVILKGRVLDRAGETRFGGSR